MTAAPAVHPGEAPLLLKVDVEAREPRGPYSRGESWPPLSGALASGRKEFLDSQESSHPRPPARRSQLRVPCRSSPLSCQRLSQESRDQRPAYLLLQRRQQYQSGGLGRGIREPKVFSTISAWHRGIEVGKDLSGESLDGCGLAPGIERQIGFATGLLQKSLAVPAMFGGNLGQQQAAANALRDD